MTWWFSDSSTWGTGSVYTVVFSFTRSSPVAVAPLNPASVFVGWTDDEDGAGAAAPVGLARSSVACERATSSAFVMTPFVDGVAVDCWPSVPKTLFVTSCTVLAMLMVATKGCLRYDLTLIQICVTREIGHSILMQSRAFTHALPRALCMSHVKAG